MAPLVKLAIIPKSGEEASFLQKLACLLHLLYTLVEKQPYLVSTSSYPLYIKAFYCLHVSDSNYKYQVRQNGR